MDYKTAVDCIKSCIVSVKGGLPIQALKADFKNQTGEDLNPKKLGYNTLEDLLISIKEIYLNKNVLIVRDEKTDHLANLISKQKGQTKVKAFKKPMSYAGSSSMNKSRLSRPSVSTLQNKAKLIEAELFPHVKSSTDTHSPQMTKTEVDSKSNVNGVTGSTFGTYTSKGNTNFEYVSPETFINPFAAGALNAGRGRGRLSQGSCQSPGGLSDSRSPARNTSSPDVRSFASSSVCWGGGSLSTSSIGESVDEDQPVLLEHQLIGENFLMKVATLIGGFKNEKGSGSSSGLCCRSLDVASCLKKLKRAHFVSERVMVLIGLTDIVKGKDLDALKADVLEILEFLRSQNKLILLLTVPIPICLEVAKRLKTSVMEYNDWLLTLKLPQTRVINLAAFTQNKEMKTLPFMCDRKTLEGWTETGCWALVEAVCLSGTLSKNPK